MEDVFEAVRWLWAHWPLMVAAALAIAAATVYANPTR